jgi:hypothetical protein
MSTDQDFKELRAIVAELAELAATMAERLERDARDFEFGHRRSACYASDLRRISHQASDIARRLGAQGSSTPVVPPQP